MTTGHVVLACTFMVNVALKLRIVIDTANTWELTWSSRLRQDTVLEPVKYRKDLSSDVKYM